MAYGLQIVVNSKSQQRSARKAKLEKYIKSLQVNKYNKRPWRSYYKISPVTSQLFQEAEDILTDPSKVAETLLNINDDTVKVLESGRPLGKCAITSALSISLRQYEDKLDLPECVNLRHTLSAEEFFAILENGAPLIDEGVSVFHGTQTHRIQYRILLEHMGLEKARSVKRAIADEWQARPHPLAGRMAGDDVNTLWDEIFDVAAPRYISNPESLPVHSLFKADSQEVTDVEDFLPCMDARSPEWLQSMCLIAPDDVGIGALKQCTSEELYPDRLREVHRHVFLTGYEMKYLDYYKKLGFSFEDSRSE